MMINSTYKLLAFGVFLPSLLSLAGAQDTRTHFQSECEASTIKPVDPATSSSLGLRVYPGGRITVGRATLESLIELAYSVEQFQIAGGPDWMNNDAFDIVLLCPASAASTVIPSSGYSWNLSPANRQILRDLLIVRFGLSIKKSLVNGPGLQLVTGTGKLAMTTTTKPQEEAAVAVAQKGSIVDGEAFARNASMDDLANEFQTDLQKIVVNKTGITGHYDFHVAPFSPENSDLENAVFGVAKKLGLQLRKATVPQVMITVLAASKPDEN